MSASSNSGPKTSMTSTGSSSPPAARTDARYRRRPSTRCTSSSATPSTSPCDDNSWIATSPSPPTRRCDAAADAWSPGPGTPRSSLPSSISPRRYGSTRRSTSPSTPGCGAARRSPSAVERPRPHWPQGLDLPDRAVRRGQAHGVRRQDPHESPMRRSRRHHSRRARRVARSPARDGLPHGPDDWMFCNTQGRCLNPDSLSQLFGRIVKRSHLPRIRFHDLRHTHATLLIAGRRPRQGRLRTARSRPPGLHHADLPARAPRHGRRSRRQLLRQPRHRCEPVDRSTGCRHTTPQVNGRSLPHPVDRPGRGPPKRRGPTPGSGA